MTERTQQDTTGTDDATATIDGTGADGADYGDRRTVLAAENLTHGYGDLVVLEGLSLEIPAGELTALIGPNGAGKTTLLRVLAGLESPDSGRVRYEGPNRPRWIGYLPQQPAFRPEFTAAETLRFYESLLGVDEPRPRTHLERVGMEAAADRPVGALSGGMRQLLGIAQAVVGDPPVVALDEPAHGLDPGMRTRIFDVLDRLAERGVAVVATTHDLAAADRRADRIGLLDRGEIVRSGTPAGLREELGVETLEDAYDASVSGTAGTVYVEGGSGREE
ncbi:MAG: ABC transporter ATP-binding protein [Haloferacaceae archaeon]